MYLVDQIGTMAGGTRGRGATPSETGDDLEKIISKVCTTFFSQIERKLNERFDKIDAHLIALSNDLKSLKSKVDTNSKNIHNIKNEIDQNAQLSKRNSLRFHNIAESEEKDTVDVLLSFINDSLKIPCTRHEIDVAFRIGERSDGRPRIVLGSFTNGWKRVLVFNAKKTLKNTGCSIFEDLTSSRYDLLMSAKKNMGILMYGHPEEKYMYGINRKIRKLY